MKFLEKNKKWFFLLSIVFFLFALGAVLLNTFQTVLNYFIYHYSITNLIVNSVSIIFSLLIGIALPVIAAVCLRTEKGKNVLPGVGALWVLSLLWSFLLDVFFVLAYYDVNILNYLKEFISIFIRDAFLLIFVLFLMIVPFLKAKGPVIPILGIALIVLSYGVRTIYQITAIWHSAEFLFEYLAVSSLLSLLANVVGLFGVITTGIGLLLLVPAAIYIPWQTAEAEVNHEDIPETVE